VFSSTMLSSTELLLAIAMNVTFQLGVDDYNSTTLNNLPLVGELASFTEATNGQHCDCCDAGSDQSSSSPTDGVRVDCYPRLLHVVTALDRYLTPIIVAVGVVGNVVSFLVFTATYLRRMSSSVYLAALAIVDTVFLIVLFFTWLTSFDVQVSESDEHVFGLKIM